MFAWASNTFDKLSQTIAPPPTDGAGKFTFAVQKNDEHGAMGCLAEIDPFTTIVNQAKGTYPVHLACQYSMIGLFRRIMSIPGANSCLGATDSAGNTPLHYAAISSSPDALQMCKTLITEFGASAMVKNYAGQTPYDVCSVNSIRQYLLPIQLQAETQYAIDNGGIGLPPGIDMGGLRIQNSAMPPPPSQFGAGGGGGPPPPSLGYGQGPPPPTMSPLTHSKSLGYPPQHQQGTPNMFGTPTPGHTHLSSSISDYSPAGRVAPAPASMPVHLVQPAPTSGNHEYARNGSSSAAIFSKPQQGSRTFVRPDGFHSSSSDVNLQKKYGHQAVGLHAPRNVPPPPSSGGGNGHPILSAPYSAGSGGANPYAGGTALAGASRYGALPATKNRYVNYGPTAPASAPPQAYNYHAPAPMPVGVTTFTPGMAPFEQFQQQQQQHHYASPSPQPVVQSMPGVPEQGQQGQQYEPQQEYHQQQPQAGPSTPYMPQPPYQTRYNPIPHEQHQEEPQYSAYSSPYSGPNSNNTMLTPSPANATYGSTMTPGTALETPSGGFSSFNNEARPIDTSDLDAKELFACPPPNTATAVAPVDASSLFASAPPEQQQQQNSAQQSPHQQPQSAEALFGMASPSMSSPPFGLVPPPAGDLQRTKSAEEMFDEGPPDIATPQSNQPELSENLPILQGHQEQQPDNPPPQQQPYQYQEYEQPLPAFQEYERPLVDAYNDSQPSMAPLSMDGGGGGGDEPPFRARAMRANELFASSFEEPKGALYPTESTPVVIPAAPKSAEEVFSEIPLPTAPKSTEEAFAESRYEGNSGSYVAMQPPSIPQPYHASAVASITSMGGGGGAADFFGGGPGGSAGSGSAEQVFGAAPIVQTHEEQPAATLTAVESYGGEENEEEDMTEVPLSPGGVFAKSPLLAVPTQQQQPQNQSPVVPQSTPAASSAESLFAAIGLPPPPMSYRR
jgi:hypothetical protein